MTVADRALPLAWLDPRRKIPLSVRLGVCSEYLISRCSIPPLPEKPAADLDYVTMVGKPHALLLRESLLSVCRTWSRIPRLTVVSDGSWKAQEIQDFLAWWPQPVVCEEPPAILGRATTEESADLRKLAAAHPLGLKLATLAVHSAQHRFIFVDSDVLFFQDPLPWISVHNWEQSPAASVEPHGSFSRSLAEAICGAVLTPPFINSGFVLIGRPLSKSALWPLLLRKAAETPSEEFNEQTIIACLVRQDGQTISQDRFLNRFDDGEAIFPRLSRNGGARHYVRYLRHLFYRDALLLRVQRLFSTNWTRKPKSFS